MFPKKKKILSNLTIRSNFCCTTISFKVKPELIRNIIRFYTFSTIQSVTLLGSTNNSL